MYLWSPPRSPKIMWKSSRDRIERKKERKYIQVCIRPKSPLMKLEEAKTGIIFKK